MVIKRKIHEVIAPLQLNSKTYLDQLAAKRYGLHTGFAKTVGENQHIIVTLKNIPEFVDDIGLREYFKFREYKLRVRKVVSSKLQLNQKMDDVFERLGGKTTVLYGGFAPRIRRPKYHITKLIREGLTAKNFKNLVLDDSTPLEVFYEALYNHNKYLSFIRLLRRLKTLGAIHDGWGELEQKAERI